MNVIKQLEAFIEKESDQCWKEFIDEISTDENKDYRRGFKAGLLCSHLYLNSEIRKFTDVTDKQQAD